MSAIAAPSTSASIVAGPTAFSRLWRVVRLHYTNWTVAVVLPWAILIGILGVNLTIWYLIVWGSGGDTGGMSEGTQYTGSIFYLFIYQTIFAIQLMNATFAYAMGLSSTRRDYYVGTALLFALHAAMFTAGIVLLSYVEQWTSGWGVGGHMFQTVYLGTGPLWERLFTVFFGLLGVMFLGSIFGAVYVRWRAYGLYVIFAALVLLVLAFLGLVTLTHSWGPVGRWFADMGTVGLVSWSLLLTAVCGVIGFLALRRAVPRG